MFDRNRCKRRIKELLSIDSHPAHISAGFAVGVFISFTPFYGFHALLAIVAAFVLRLNKLTCITGSFVNTPLTVVPLLVMSHKLGTVLLGLPSENLTVDTLGWDIVRSRATSIIVGSSILGFAAAILAYFLCYYLVVRFRRRDPAFAEMTKEMEQVGEELK